MAKSAAEAPTSETARRFVAAINAHDVAAIEALMTKDHRFVDAAGEVHDRAALKEGWPQFLGAFPDYRIEVEEAAAEGATVALFGRASGTFSGPSGDPPAPKAWSFPAAWKAVVRRGLVAEWRVYGDVEPMLRSMGVRR